MAFLMVSAFCFVSKNSWLFQRCEDFLVLSRIFHFGSYMEAFDVFWIIFCVLHEVGFVVYLIVV